MSQNNSKYINYSQRTIVFYLKLIFWEYDHQKVLISMGAYLEKQYQLESKIIQMGNCMPEANSKRNTHKKYQQQPRANFTRPQESWQSSLRICDISIEAQYYSNKKIQHPCFDQISKDRDRTYPLQEYFVIPQNKTKLELLLRRIAIYFPKLGYTQGMNFVAGQLLLYGMSEQQAYKSLIKMFVHPRLLFIGLYENYFPLVKIYCQIFWKLVNQQMPEIVMKIKSLIISDDMWIFQWFISFFVLSFPKEYIKDIFTFILTQKDFAHVRIAVAVMVVLKDKLESFQESFEDQFITCIQRLKDIKYANCAIPLDKILQKAKQIQPSMIYSLLPNIQCNNWYKQYFTIPQASRYQTYNNFLFQKSQQRQDFLEVNRSNLSKAHYERQQIAVQVIDQIQEKKHHRFGRFMSKSTKQKSIYRSFLVYRNLTASHHPKYSPQQFEVPFKTTFVQSVIL